MHSIPLSELQALVGPSGAEIAAHVVGGFFGGDVSAVCDLAAEFGVVRDALLSAD